MRSNISRLSAISALLLLTACDHLTQTTSGNDWLAAHPPQTVDMTPGNIDQAVRDAAAVEPLLRFPARIGIARLNGWQLSTIPPDEAKVWTDVAQHLGDKFGTFVPVSPFVVAMLEPARNPQVITSEARQTIETIRIAAARQHLDAVLIYEADATTNTKSNSLSLAEWTLIGAFVVPTENVRADGTAQAILLDVRNAYPYGTVQTSADDTASTVRFERDEASVAVRGKVRLSVVAKLAAESEVMMRKLQPELAALDKKQLH